MESNQPKTLAKEADSAPLHEFHMRSGAREWVIGHTGMVLTYDEELEFLRTQRHSIPYGAALWPASIALAHHLAAMEGRLSGLRVLELGAGTGLPGIVAASLGSRVTQTDRNELVLSICRRNAAANRIAGIEYRNVDWGIWDEQGAYDLILGADILYMDALHPSLLFIFESCLAPGGRLVLADPFRATSIRFLSHMEEMGWRVDGTRWNLGRDPDPRPVGVFELSRPLLLAP